ncbi:MAG: 50S ribosomal protein L1 [Microgenomates bacterium OLB23]|nr:MAG: 50S ribosomal protein L1 [Microgenomates bacterium OLB23]
MKKAEVESESDAEVVVAQQPDTEKKKQKKAKKKQITSQTVRRHMGKKYVAAKKSFDKNTRYALADAIALLKKNAYASFDESFEVHINLTDSNVKGEVAFPHGTGKQVKVAVADDALLAKVDEGVIDFDILIATPAFMPKLVKYARVLGPKGLMPNPKNGTVVEDTKKAVEKFQTGSVRFKSEAKFPLLHLAVGKKSFEDKQLSENISALLAAVQRKNVQKVFLATTMSPSVEIEFEKIVS